MHFSSARLRVDPRATAIPKSTAPRAWLDVRAEASALAILPSPGAKYLGVHPRFPAAHLRISCSSRPGLDGIADGVGWGGAGGSPPGATTLTLRDGTQRCARKPGPSLLARAETCSTTGPVVPRAFARGPVAAAVARSGLAVCAAAGPGTLVSSVCAVS